MSAREPAATASVSDVQLTEPLSFDQRRSELSDVVHVVEWHLALDSLERQLRRMSTITHELRASLRGSRRELESLRLDVRSAQLQVPDTRWASLTNQERRVALLAASGHSRREIAVACEVTTNTVKTHLRHIHRKLQTRTDWDLARLLAVRRQPQGLRGRPSAERSCGFESFLVKRGPSHRDAVV